MARIQFNVTQIKTEGEKTLNEFERNQGGLSDRRKKIVETRLKR